jgi:hypothetical protein
MKSSSLSLVQDLKAADQDFEWYPTTDEQIALIIDDMKRIKGHFDFVKRYSDDVKFLDIGAGDGRVLNAVQAAFAENEDVNIEPFAIEKAALHTGTYRQKGITLLGTEFYEINFISKHCQIGFVNPPYSDFSTWLQTLITQLNFGLLYAVIPKRWENDGMILEAMKLRGVSFSKILGESDFASADRQARAKVHVVRFSFEDVDEITPRFKDRRYKPVIGRDAADPFQMFIENELGLNKTYSKTTEVFSEAIEKARIRAELKTPGTVGCELVVSKGVLGALLDNYERDLQRVLSQYTLISQLDTTLLQELGVDHEGITKGIKEKLLGYRNVYWALVFENLDALSGRLIGTYRESLLKTLSDNALDFTHENAVYIINYAVDMANEMIESSLTDVYEKLTCSDSISRYYKSNARMYNDNWRYNNQNNHGVKYLLDYRFVYTARSNFGLAPTDEGITAGARTFCNDLMVVLRLLGYSHVRAATAYDDIPVGGTLSIMGCEPGADKPLELINIKLYKNGNRHLRFNQAAMLRFNVTVSRLLGWVRNKNEFEDEGDMITPLDERIWAVSDTMKVMASQVLLIRAPKAA